jgi:hypothetical protein
MRRSKRRSSGRKKTLDVWIAALGGGAILLIGAQVYICVSTFTLFRHSTSNRSEPKDSQGTELVKKAGAAFAQVLASSQSGDGKPVSATASAPEGTSFAKSREEAVNRFDTLPSDPKWEHGLRAVQNYFVSTGSQIDKCLTIALAGGEMGQSGDPQPREAKAYAFSVLLENPVESIHAIHRAALALDGTAESAPYRETLVELVDLMTQTPGIDDPGVREQLVEIQRSLATRAH